MKEIRAARWTPARELEIDACRLGDPGPGQAQVEVRSAGICGSDLHFYRGEFKARPGIVPGHEVAGTVTAAGAGVRHVREGDLVGIEPLLSCGTCGFCLTGNYHVCTERGLVGETAGGGMSELATVPARTAYRAPAGADGEVIALAEPLACSVHGYAKVNLRARETVLIIGAGTIGLTALIAAKASGASALIVARHPHQQEAARRLGADEVIADDAGGHDRLAELSEQRVVDVAVETVGGRGDTLLQAQLAVRPKGRLLLLGVFTVPTVGINPLLLAAREVEIVGSMTYAASNGRADYQIAMEIVADHAAAARSLITQRFPLAAVHRAFGVALDKSSRSIKVHINPNG
jgi:threonine dehydrogenase-like Zn-dependent dehydrogenase